MTDIGESVAVTRIKLDKDPQYHFTQLQICFPNGKPFISSENILINMVIDGDERSAQTNFDACVNQSLLDPGTQVEFKIEETVDDEIAEIRSKINDALDVILEKERDEKNILDTTLKEYNPLSRSLILTGAFMSGVGDGALSIIEFIGDTAELAYDTAWYKHQITVANNLEAAWETMYKQGDVEDFFDSVKQKDVEDFAKAFGKTPQELALQITEAYYVFNFIMDDGETQSMLADFAINYAKAQSKVEIARMSGAAAFDIILTAILAVTTGGAGNVAQITAKIKHFDYFKKLAQLLRQLVGKLERKLAQKNLQGKLDSKTQHKITPPEPQKVEPKQSKKPAESGQSKNQSDADTNQTNSHSSDEGPSAESSGAGSQAPQDSGSPGKNKQDQTCAPDNKTCTDGEPISLVTGEEMLTLEDFVLPGPMALAWNRTYKSSNPDNCGLGFGWTHSFAEHLEIVGNRLQFHTSEARVVDFDLPAVNVSCTNRSEKLVMTRSGESQFELRSSEPGANQIKQFTRAPGEKPFRLKRIYDAFGNGFDLQYHHGRLVEIQAPYGDRWQFEYNEQNTLATVYRNAPGSEPKAVVEYHYNDLNDLIEAFDGNGNSERYQYRNHLIQKRTLKSGYSFYFKWDASDHHARCLEQWGDPIEGQATYHYKFNWDKPNRKVAVTDTRGGTQVYQFNDHGLPVYHRDAEGGETLTRYDEFGNVTSIKTPNGHFKNFTYDEHQRLIIYADALGSKHELKRNRQGLITTIYDPAGQCWSRKYNDSGVLAEQTNPLGDTLKFSHNNMGLISAVTNSEGQSWHYLWDHKGLLTAVRAPNGKHTRYTYNGDSLLQKITYPDGKVSQYEYDDAGHCIYIESPDGTSKRFEYNSLGLVTKTTDQSGRATHYSYNGLSQVVRKVDPAGQVLHYHYDGERNLVGLTNQNGERYQLIYDLNERLIQEIGFDGRIQEYHYDAEGFLIGKADLSRDRQHAINEIAFKRDANGRLLQQAQLTEQGLNPLNEYRYDSLGRMEEASNASRTLKWVYDPIGRLLEEHQDQYITRHHYSQAGGRSGTTLPDGQTLEYSFNDDGLFEALNLNGQRVAQIERNASGQEVSRQLSNQLNTDSRYDPQGRLIAQRTGKYTNEKKFKPINQRRLHYNDQGLLQQIDDTLRGQTRYHYDQLDRLTKVGGPNPENFIHDPAGNILATQTPGNISSPGRVQGNRLSFHGDKHYDYDELGNRIGVNKGKKQTVKTHYQYDALNQLCQFTCGEQSTRYAYDPLGRRISKKQGNNTVEFLWLGDVLLSETAKQKDEVKHHKTYLFEPDTFRPLAFVQDKKVYHYHLDHLGTPQEITDNQGKLVWAVSYRAYGNLAVAHKNEIENNLRFQGQYFDEESGLHYNRFRYYDPECGRFVNQDPIGLLGGENNYLYAPNPINWVDPYGLSCKEGFAIVRLYDNGYQEGHLTVETIDSDITYFTDQVITSKDRSTTTIRRSGTHFANQSSVHSVEIPLKDVAAARAHQKSQINEDLGPYDLINNSCYSHVFDVLEAGGCEPIQRSKRGFFRFMKSNGFERLKHNPPLG